MKAAIQEHGDAVRFVFKPIALPGWTHSVPQVAAMYEAAKQGKFIGMMEAQFEQQAPRTGLSLEQLQAIARDLEMDVEAMTQAIQSGAYDSYITTQQQTARMAGVTGVPAILINGRHMDGPKTPDCLNALVANVQAEVGE